MKKIPTNHFKRSAKTLHKRYKSFITDFEKLLKDLDANPLMGTDLGAGFRKIRLKITSKSKGKSGGARVITLTSYINDDTLYLIEIYDKEYKANITSKELQKLLKDAEL
ncbi:MAG: type II toxin-antitoxin system RelE/ParE family toxin [Prevotella sp.]|jgi:hypothetical protein|nr:type II toxin-antitoxin system RelE/ParE family toxin [Prevotella sp.]